MGGLALERLGTYRSRGIFAPLRSSRTLHRDGTCDEVGQDNVTPQHAPQLAKGDLKAR